MNFTLQELQYIVTVLNRTSSYTIARGEQIDYPTINHKQLTTKVKQIIHRYTH
jgi:hypothetical protein